MPTDDQSQVRADWGHCDGYWDISFTEAQRAYAGITDPDEQRSISVHVDAATGQVSLNNGYEPGSKPYKQEHALFDNFQPSIDAALIDAMSAASPEYAAFIARTTPEAERRATAMKETDAEVSLHLLASEDSEDEVA